MSSCFDFPALCLSDSLFIARRLVGVLVKTAAVICVSTDATVSRRSVANKSSALFSSSSIVSCGAGTSNAVRNAFGSSIANLVLFGLHHSHVLFVQSVCKCL